MAWDLWGSSYVQEHPQWQCDFFFGYGPDVIEENALNEKYCVQVLRILITKADTEIAELEKDLLSLQNELAWTEHEKWPEICCSALTERINRLDVAICNLKKEHADEVETRVLLHHKPAETLDEIVKALQKGHYQDRNDQLIDGNVMNVSEYAPKKECSDIDSNIVIKEEGNELSGTSENSRSSDLQLELQEKRMDDAEKVEVEKLVEELLPMALVISPDLGDISCSTGHSEDGMKLSGTSDDGDTGNEEVKRCQLIATDTSQILNMLSLKENGNITGEAKSEIAIVKENNVSLNALRLPTGIKGRQKCVDSCFGASHQRKGRNSDFERKLSEFALQAAQRACKSESKVVPAEGFSSMNCPLQVVFPRDLCPADTELCSFESSNGMNSPQVINIQNTGIMHGENSALISLFEMKAKNGTYTALQLTDEEKPQLQGLESKIDTSLMKSNSFPSKNKPRGKRKSELETFSTEEPHDRSTAVITNTPLMVSTKGERKSTTNGGDASFSESMKSRMTTKRAVQPGLHETNNHAIVPYDSEFSELQKRRVVSKFPTNMEISKVELDLPNPNRVSSDDGSLVGSQTENTPGSFLETLKKLSMNKLRAIAKENNVKKYHKLPKGALIDLLVEQLVNCRANN